MTREQMIEAVNAQTLKTAKIRTSKSSLAYKTAIEAINNPGVEIVCGANTGSGSYASSKSWQAVTALLLRQAGIEYSLSNVAPKGGKHGDRITVILK